MLITGGSRGIGRATAIAAGRAGYDVAINYRADQAAADSAAEAVRGAGGDSAVFAADMGEADDVARLFREVEERFGRLDCFVNNAGIVARAARVDQLDAPRISRIFAINVVGAFLAAGEAVRRMSTAKGGRGGTIVNVSSAAARLAAANDYVDYAASKAAIDTLTIGLSKEVGGEGIRVNAIRPGLIETDIHADIGDPDRPRKLAAGVPMQRPGTADECADLILYLASDAASYVNGAIIDVTGGR